MHFDSRQNLITSNHSVKSCTNVSLKSFQVTTGLVE